jgi:Trypsin
MFPPLSDDFLIAFLIPNWILSLFPLFLTNRDSVEIQGRKFSTSQIFIHASYNQPKFANDIAIIELDKENDGEINDAVCLPKAQTDVEHDLKSTIAVVKRAGGALKFGKALFNANTECTSYFNQQLTDLTPGQFCANVQSNDTVYSPFIGAIAIQSDVNRQYTFKGFTSTAIRSSQAFDESKPYIFTDIAHHLNWIEAAIGDDLKKVQNQKPATRIDDNEHSLRSCSTGNDDGLCVKLHQCALYRDAPKPLSRRLLATLEEKKCFTTAVGDQNNLQEDGICCPPRYIELNYTEGIEIHQRFQGKRGVELLNMDKCGKVAVSHRIVGGSEAGLKEFPWIALIKYKTGRIFKYTCGSSLISEKYVLTCAHCISNLPPGYEIAAVRLGEYDRSADPDCRTDEENQQECNPPVQDILIEKLIPHPKYNTPRYANDVGLVRLSDKPDMTQGMSEAQHDH